MHVLLTDINELEKRIKCSHREVRTSSIPPKKPQTFCLLRLVKLQQTCQFHQVATSPVKSGLPTSCHLQTYYNFLVRLHGE